MAGVIQSIGRSTFAATILLALLAPSSLTAKDREVDQLVELAGRVERNALREIDLPAARARLVEAGRTIQPERAANLDRCVARGEVRSLATTVAGVLACARFSDLGDAARVTKEGEFARLLVSFSGFPQDRVLDAAEIALLMDGTAGGAIGLGLANRDGRIAIVRSYRGSPAREAGIGPGWQLLAVDGTAYSGDERAAAIAALQGKIGTSVVLGLVDPQGMAREVVLGRVDAARIVADMDFERSEATLTVQIYVMTGGISGRVKALIEAQGEEASRIVLDLRGNTGGVLDEAVGLADLFLERGRIATVRGRRGVETVHDATRGAIAPNAQIIVLVDKDTAAGAELLAAALADNARATVLGEATRGFGTIRTLFPYRRNSAVMLTTLEFLRPSGEPIEGRGVQPEGPA